MKIMVNKIGFWKEYTKSETDSSILEMKTSCLYQNKELIIKYLSHGKKVLGIRESPSIDPFSDGTKFFSPHAASYTDGKWVWTEGIIELFKRYDLCINTLFIEHIENASYEPPRDISADFVDELINTIEESYWNNC